MNEMLKDFIGKFVIVYLDDILVYNRTKEEHLRYLKMVLKTMIFLFTIEPRKNI